MRAINGKSIFERTLALLSGFGRRGKRFFGTQRLQPQLICLVCAAMVVAVASLWGTGLQAGTRVLLPLSPSFALLWTLGMACAVAAAWQAKYHRLAALMLMGGAGLCTCITFVWFSAPDLALTQLTVEVVTTVLFLLGLRWLPMRVTANQNAPVSHRTAARRARDLAIAAAAGTGMALLAYMLMSRPFPEGISTFFLERALPEGGGKNVVNVMLVDFRGFDTFGEIVVLGIVALTVYALLRRFRPAPETMQMPPQQRSLPPERASDLLNPRHARDTAVGYLMVPAVLVRLLLPLATMVAVYLFLRGHNAPGGGFVAGLVMSVALLLQYIVSGTQWVEAHLYLRPRYWMGLGMLCALATGLGSLAFGYPFMTTHTAHLHLPLLGDIHIASALFFDIGVFTLVVGAAILILTALAHQSVRGHRQPGQSKEGAA
ncbi:MAG: monovalent cation/H+ antiporter subunit [Rhodoferax sp.]|nr:monovalent cation/H+ antiporter subunit [Rhodoferax sp.]